MKIKLIKITIFLCIIFLIPSCAITSKTNTRELENKGSSIGVSAPDWIKIYLSKGISGLQSLNQYKDKYCFVGEESGVNRQFVISWADSASTQQRIASFLRINIASRYEAAVTGTSQSSGLQEGAVNSSSYRQEINNIINAVVNVSYSGAQREADWWSLYRRTDPDSGTINNEYTAWVLYTIPKEELNRQLAFALGNSVSRDSALYDITIALARDILLQGYDEKELQNAASIQRTASNNYDPPGTITARGIEEIDLIDEYVVGREVAAFILSKYQIYNGNPSLTYYLNQILYTLVINSPKPAAYNGYYIGILESDSFNAFATPGGHIFITRGLIASAKSEDAIAALIAHELAHIQLRHGMRAIRSNRDTQDWVSQFMFSGGQAIADRINAGFSQTQEFDADISALSLLIEAGYNPHSLIDILQELEKFQGSGIMKDFNSTHPSPTSRLVNVKVAAARYMNITDNSRHRQRRFEAVVR